MRSVCCPSDARPDRVRDFRYAYAILGCAWLVRGELDKAVVELDAAIESARLADPPKRFPGISSAGRWWPCSSATSGLALEHARESVELTSDLAGSHLSALSAVALAGAQLEVGQTEGAVERLVKSAGGEELTWLPGGAGGSGPRTPDAVPARARPF